MRECWYKDVCQNDCDCYCLRFAEMSYLIEHSGVPENKCHSASLSMWVDPDDYDAYCDLADIKSGIKEFVDAGKNIYIYSNITGNGKTTWAIKLLLKYFDEVWAGNGFRTRGLFISVPAFLTQLKNFNSKSDELERIKSELGKVDLVVWDDIASTHMSNYDHSQLLSYIDQRVLAGKSNIYTGNLDKYAMEKQLGSRLTSRIWNDSERFEFKGRDKR